MFQHNTTFSFIFKNSSSKISTQQLYTLYLTLGNSTKNLTFSEFCVFVNLHTHNFTKNQNKTFLFLGAVFFFENKSN